MDVVAVAGYARVAGGFGRMAGGTGLAIDRQKFVALVCGGDAVV